MQSRLISLAAPLFVFAALLPACGSSGSDTMEEPMTGTVDSFGSDVTALEDQMNEHAAVISGAAEMKAVTAEESKHAEAEMTVHHELGTLIDHMGMCMKDGAAPNTDSIALRLDDLGKEIEAHQQAMGKAADLEAALAEESRHEKAILDFTHDMHMEHETMAKTAGSYMCPMHSM